MALGRKQCAKHSALLSELQCALLETCRLFRPVKRSFVEDSQRSPQSPVKEKQKNTCHILFYPFKSQNHRMVGVGRDLCGSSSPTLLPKQGHL